MTMRKTRRLSEVQRTPGGVHLRLSDSSVDEIEFDDEVVIKSSVFRGKSNLPSETLKACGSENVKSTSKKMPKSVVRDSTDLRKIRRIDDKIEAILASPMIEVRRKPAAQSKSFTYNHNERTPIRVPSSKDLAAVSSRRMSAIVMSRFAPFLHSVSFSEGNRTSSCFPALNRRKTTGNRGTPVHHTTYPGSVSPKGRHTLTTPVANRSSSEKLEAMDVDDVNNCENIPPSEIPGDASQDGPIVSTGQNASSDEPTSVSEFRVLVGMESSRLSSAKAAWEDVMAEESESIPDVALSSIRAAVGKCGLLLAKKFPFFSSLIDITEESLRHQTEEVEITPQQRANINDLLGMWTIISQQINDIDKSFERLRRWRETSGWALSSPPVTPGRPAPPFGSVQSARTPHLPRSGQASSSTVAKMKRKASLKRLLSMSSKSKTSRLRASKPAQRSNFSRFREQMLTKKKVMRGNEEEGGVLSRGLHENNSPVISSSAISSKCGQFSSEGTTVRQNFNIPADEEATMRRISESGGLYRPATPMSPLSLNEPDQLDLSMNESAPNGKSFTPTGRGKELEVDVTSADDAIGVGRQSRTPSRRKVTGENIDSAGKTPVNANDLEITRDSFTVPISRPRGRIRKGQSTLSTPQPPAAITTPNPFSPPPRPVTGTPRPHLSPHLRTAPDFSLRQSLLSKKLMLAVTCGNSSRTAKMQKPVRLPSPEQVSTSSRHFDNSADPRQPDPPTSDGQPRRCSSRVLRQRASTTPTSSYPM